MTMSGHVSPVRVFAQTKKKTPSSRGIKQRFIISSLALQKLNMTRGEMAKLLAKEFYTPQVNAYHYVLKELDDCLIPNGIVEEAGTLPPHRGSRIIQANGIPCYRLTEIGALLASSLINLDIEKKIEFLESHYLVSRKISSTDEHVLSEQLLPRLRKYPESTLEMIKDFVYEFINGGVDNPLQLIQNKIQSLS